MRIFPILSSLLARWRYNVDETFCRNFARIKKTIICGQQQQQNSSYHYRHTLTSTIQQSQQEQQHRHNMKSKPADRIAQTGKSVWVEFTALAHECNAVNVGQGFPDFAAPEFITNALTQVSSNPNVLFHQYTRSFGHPRLVNALAKMYSRFLGREINPMTEITIAVGAYSALFYAVFGLINPGDEAIIIEPFYDCYKPQVQMAGGVPIYVPLRPRQRKDCEQLSSGMYELDFDELESKFSPKTKLLFLNNPSNPLGKVFNKHELSRIAQLVEKYDVVVISDEVYEWIIYPGAEMIRFATLPGMWNRTITIGSAGKTFSVTGWKLGWAIAPPNLMKCLQAVHQNCSYTCPTPTQEATAIAFEQEIDRLQTPRSYFLELSKGLLQKRERMFAFLSEVNMEPIMPEGGYFMLADYSSLRGPFDAPGDEPKDYRFVRWLCREKKLAAIPPTAFYSDENRSMGENLVRFCFFKSDETLSAAESIIREWKRSMHA